MFQYLKFIFIISSIFFSLTLSYGADTKMNDLTELSNIKLSIKQIGDPVLRKVARTLTKDEILSPAIQKFIVQMKDTMHDAPGVGLAAPQVGVSLQIAVIEDREEYLKFLKPEDVKARDRRPVAFHVIINPTLTILHSEKQANFFEGCLSVDGYMGKVSRALEVKVDALNEKGEPITIHAQGWYARILQHEIGHLNGTLYIDHMDTKTFTTVENYKKYQM
jgi:peptide deformylase